MRNKFICIEGNIGVGKTSLTKKIAKDWKMGLILERFIDNPFLRKFYQDKNKYAFQLEVSFLIERYNQLQQFSKKRFPLDFIISDYFFGKSFIFGKNNLMNDEFRLFHKLFNIMSSSLLKPDLVIYLHSDIDNLKQNIKKRGRSFESAITKEYLQNIQQSYLDFFAKQTDIPVLIIDVRGSDFLRNKDLYERILLDINKDYPVGVHKILL